MINMGYCRFQNTLLALHECEEHIEDDISEEEGEARAYLLSACKRIVANYEGV